MLKVIILKYLMINIIIIILLIIISIVVAYKLYKPTIEILITSTHKFIILYYNLYEDGNFTNKRSKKILLSWKRN